MPSKLLVTAALVAAFSFPAHARDPEGQYANSPNHDWYQNAELTEAAQKRLGFKSCCAHSDVVRTRFRPSANGDDGWEYVDAKGQWQRVPDDIIHEDTFAPGGQPIMFAIGGLPTCFFKPQGGI